MWVWLCVYVSMCTCICVYRCIYYVCERVFIKLFYLKFFKGKNAFEIWESMGPWLGVVQWAEVILHWQGPKSNDLCISWIFPRWNPHDCPNTAGDGEKQIAGDELNEVTKGGNRHLLDTTWYNCHLTDRSGKAWLWKCWRVECTIASSMSPVQAICMARSKPDSLQI